MNRKTLLIVMAAVLTVGMLGCRRESPTARQGTQRGTTKTPGATPEAPSEVGKAPGTAPGTAGQAAGTAGQAVAQQKQEFIATAEKTLNNLEQQAQTASTQAPEQDREKAQQLQQQLQQQIADARQNLNKLRDASADTWRDMSVAVNNSIQNAQGTFKELQSITGGQRQVTKQP